MLKILLHSAWLKGAKLCIAERGTRELERAAQEYQAEYITDCAGLFSFFSRLLPQFAQRNKKKQELLRQGAVEEEIFRHMSKETPLFVFLADLGEFLRMVYQPDEGIGNMSGFLENILEKGSLHHIYFIGCLKAEDESTLGIFTGYRLFTGYRQGIHLGGNLALQKIFSFQNIAYAQQTKSLKKGMGHVPDAGEESCGVEVVIPLAQK